MKHEDYIGSAVFICILGGAISVFIAWFNMVRAAANRKDGGSFFDGRHSPSWYLLHPELLTDRGLHARRWAFYGFAGFATFFVLAFVVPVVLYRH